MSMRPGGLSTKLEQEVIVKDVAPDNLFEETVVVRQRIYIRCNCYIDLFPGVCIWHPYFIRMIMF